MVQTTTMQIQKSSQPSARQEYATIGREGTDNKNEYEDIEQP